MYTSLPQVLGVFLTAAYMVVKGRIFVRALKLWRAAGYKLLQSTTYCTSYPLYSLYPLCRYGQTPDPDLMKASGGFCPICQDAYQVLAVALYGGLVFDGLGLYKYTVVLYSTLLFCTVHRVFYNTL